MVRVLGKEVAAELFRLLKELETTGKAELKAQGHVATGKGIASIEALITEQSVDRLVGVIMAEDYLIGPVDKGVKRSRIPYTPGKSRARTSLYIQGLINWIRTIKPSLSDQERKGFAFAIAATHKKEGMPTRGSYAFSANGRRKGWIENGIVLNAEGIERRLRLLELFTARFEKAVFKAAA